MKRFSVKPRSFHSKEALIGASEDLSSERVLLGRLAEAGPITFVNFDLSSEHVIAIFGKRGSGKSYTLGSILEGLCARENNSTISKISKTRGILLFDTLGIFQWMDIPLSLESGQEIIQEQLSLHKGWDIHTEPLDVLAWIPQGDETGAFPKKVTKFTINISDFDASDWGYLFGLDIFQDRMGQLLNDAYTKVVWEGWQDSSRSYRPTLDYSLDDLINCVKLDRELQESYQSETRRAISQQLSTYKRNPLFQATGTKLSDLLRPGCLSVLVMNKMSDELRFVVLTALIRKIIQARIDASQAEKQLKILPNLSPEERESLQNRVASSIPPSWIVLDEAQNALPSERRTTASNVLVKLVREGRNYGLSFMLTTQQPSAVDQRILAQVDTVIAHKLTVQTDIDYVRRNLKSSLPDEVKYANNILSFDGLLRTLDIGQALVSNTESERAFILDIRPRVSVHGGF